MEMERLVPQEETTKRAEEDVHGVVLDPDSIRELLAKLKEKEK